MASAFWSCAEQIEEWAGPAYDAVLWFLVSDSKALRKVQSIELTTTVVVQTLPQSVLSPTKAIITVYLTT